jgi:hypothetical protein
MVEAPIAVLSHHFKHALAEPDHTTAHVFQQPTLSFANRDLRTNFDVFS